MLRFLGFFVSMTEGVKRFWILLFGSYVMTVGLYGDDFTVTLFDKGPGQFAFNVERCQGEFTSVRGRFSENEQKKMFCEKRGSVAPFSMTDEEVMFAIDERFFTIGSDRRVVFWSQKDDDTFCVGIFVRDGVPFWICFEHVKSGKVYINTREYPKEADSECSNPYAEIEDFGEAIRKSVTEASVRKVSGMQSNRKEPAKTGDFTNDDPGFFSRKK